jgi:hypothetical protein
MVRTFVFALLIGVMGCSGGNGNGDPDGRDAGDGDGDGYVNGDDAGAGGDDASAGGDDAGIGGDDAGVGGDDAGIGGDDGGGGDEVTVDLETACYDNQDNDNDGLTDCEDTDCAISACGLELVGGIHISKVVPDVGSWSGSCVYTGHQIYSFPNPGELFAITHHARWFKAYFEGDCYFMAELMPGNCGGGCGANQWCNTQSVCEDLPVPAPAGTLTITGMPVGTKTIPPDGNGEYHLTFNEACFDVSESHTSATPITMTASGGDTSAFSMTVQGVDFILPALNCDPNLPPQNQDLVFTWTPANDGSWVRLYLPTWHHAGMGSAVICEVPDAGGSLTVPAAMINYYLAAGADPARTYSLARLQRAVVDIGGGYGVALEVMADRACDYFH